MGTGLFITEIDNIPNPTNKEDKEIERNTEFYLVLHLGPIRTITSIMKEDESVCNGIPGEREQQRRIPEEPMTKGSIRTPRTATSLSNHICPQ